MKTIRRLVLAACLAFGPQAVFAQWTFNVTFHISGECATSEARMAVNNWNNMWQTQVLPAMQQSAMTREECERMRTMIESICSSFAFHDRYCSVTWTIGPCVGKDPPGSELILGPSQGSSYFSPNPADEVLNWASDVKNREFALQTKDRSWVAFESEYIKTQMAFLELDNYMRRKQRFDLIGLSKGSVNGINLKTGELVQLNNYIEEKELLLTLVQNFFVLTDVNIIDLFAKEPKTDEDVRMIAVFMEWSQKTFENLEKAKNMAIISALEYDDANKDLACYTTYKMINSTQVPDKPVERLSKLIEMCNDEPLNQGFHADLFYDKTTGEYAVSYRGTEFPGWERALLVVSQLLQASMNPTMGLIGESPRELMDRWLNDLAEGNTDKLPPDLKDLATNVSQGIGNVLTQYKMAIEIGDVIRQLRESNPNIIINITGHSLGGGLGTIAGIVSGAPTYVFNPAGVHTNTIEYANVSDKVEKQQYNITRFSTDDDPLTNVQEPISTKWSIINTQVKGLAKRVAENQTNNKSESQRIANQALPKAIGNKVMMHTGKDHSIEPMAQKMMHYVDIMKRAYKKRGDEISSCNIYYEE